MLYFPQLKTGALIQFPCTKQIVQRTITNEAADGRAVKLFDPGACTVQWRFGLRGLAEEEWSAIDGLFGAVEGRLGSFVFLDPFSNLLKWSESLGAAAWVKDGAIELTEGAFDPFGMRRATRVVNSGPAVQSLRQSVAAPGWFQYCWSAYVRSDSAAATVRLFATAGYETAGEDFAVGASWRRVELAVPLTSQEEEVSFGVAVPAGTAVDLFGVQAEAQAGASAYKRTTTHGGVYPNASFLDDELHMTSQAPGEYSCEMGIEARAS